jgi:hypothetical protein
MNRRTFEATPSALLAALSIAALCGCRRADAAQRGIPPRAVADGLHAVIAADRAVYTREVVSRLQNEEAVIRASEHYKDDRALPLPAQMLRMGAAEARKNRATFTYSLLSPWPINPQNAPRTAIEKTGLDAVAKNGESYYGEEELGGKRYFTAVYPDKATAVACVKCHNDHADSPRHDYKLGEVMGGLVIRIPLD